MAIFFHFDIPYFKIPRRKLIKWISSCINYYNKTPNNINIIFVSISEIISLNRKYLKHNYSTDVISFPYENINRISGDIYICASQVKKNADKYSTEFFHELYRVIIHGILHLLDFRDDTPALRNEMRILEDFWLDKI